MIPYSSGYAVFMTIVAAFSGVPGLSQLVKIIRREDSSGVSQVAWLVSAVSNLFFLIYALMLDDIPVFISSVFPLVTNTLVLISTVVYPQKYDTLL